MICLRIYTVDFPVVKITVTTTGTARARCSLALCAARNGPAERSSSAGTRAWAVGGRGGGGGAGRWTGHDTGAASLLELAGHQTRRSLLPPPPRSGRSHALALPRRLVGRTEVAPPRPCPNLPLAFRAPCCPAQSVPCGSASQQPPIWSPPESPGPPCASAQCCSRLAWAGRGLLPPGGHGGCR